MRNFILAFSVVLLAFTSCNKSGYTVEGSFDQDKYDGKTFYLYWMNLDSLDVTGPILLDSAVINQKAYTFKGSISHEPEMGLLASDKLENLAGNDSVEFIIIPTILENGQMTTIHIDSLDAVTSGGSPMNDEFNKMNLLTNNIFAEMPDMSGEADSPLTDEQKAQIEKINALHEDLQKETFNFIKSNIANPVGRYMFVDAGGKLNKAQIIELLSLCDPAYIEKQPQLKQQKDFLAEQQALRDKFIGKNIEDVELYDMGGKVVKLLDNVEKGKNVLVYFWASSDEQSLMEMNNLKDMFALYQDKGFNIVGVAVDARAEMVQMYIDGLGLGWTQLHDAEAKASMYYSVQSIPFSLLVGKDGKIINVNLRGKELRVALEELFN